MDMEGVVTTMLRTSSEIIPQMETPSQMDDDGTSSNDWTPQMGMEFNDVDEAWEFWKIYALKIGFGVRRRVTNKGKDGSITSTRFCCAKEGHRQKDKRLELVKKPRPETRMDCHARMGIKLVRESGKYFVYDFEPMHSHPLHFEECTHLIRSHMQISDVQAQQIVLGDNAGLTQRQQHDLSSVQSGGRENVGYTRVDVKNYLHTKRGRDMEFGDAGCLLKYFEKRQILDTSFFYLVHLDSNEQITNIFWADSRMVIDYALFGDVVTFDTTFSTNKEYRPLGVFIGFNHHRELVIFGAALLYDETADSFKWLFETFLGAHKYRRPATIFTDQDAAMSKALEEVIPETRHGLCTWHLMQNAMKNVGHLMRNGSNFLTDLKKLVYEYVEVKKFEEAWDSLLSTYEATDNSWLQNLYRLKEKWARCYMKSTVTLGIHSTQLSESLNGDLKDYLACNVNLNGFFKRFDKVVSDKRYKELQAEFNAREKLPTILCRTSPMLQQASKVYTPSMFENFRTEWMKTLSLVIKERNEMDILRGICCWFIWYK
ncbi:protein FAR1-RELATED SEQUENCE 5-like [Rhodamnia argentea]|uniref:Protein FAR1-RELATED SEQUENCE 5-like n=1 Tax=Rhodamnia argentea TaxID=178133 RepID=A0ABM3GX84_9MYRT|nr:protein FAR1-RELATED SEQUENCE 5-like [Rhodamnia argentea]